MTALVASADAPAHYQQGHLDVVAGAGFTVVDQGVLAEHRVPKTQAKDLTALLGLRDTTTALLSAEAADRDDSQHPARPAQHPYDADAKQFGPINRIS